MTDRLIDIGGVWVNADGVVAVEPGRYWNGSLSLRVWTTGGHALDCHLRPTQEEIDAAVAPEFFSYPDEPPKARWYWPQARKAEANTLRAAWARSRDDLLGWEGDYQQRRWEAAAAIVKARADRIIALIVDEP